MKRGKWYQHSWKGDNNKSGGICTNIGIHFFDLLTLLYGESVECSSTITNDVASGWIKFKDAFVNWELRTDAVKPCRKLVIDGNEVDLTHGFEDLHTESYRMILSGEGFKLTDARASIELLNKIICAG